MNEQNKCKGERGGGSRNYASISSLKDARDSSIIIRMWKRGRGVDLGEQSHRRREIWLCKFRLKYSTLVKQPRQCCRMGNLKCEEKSGIEVKISESSP